MSCGLTHLSDDLAVAVLARVPFSTRGSVRAVCRRFGALVATAAFRQERRDSGFAEFGVVVFGGEHDFEASSACWLLARGEPPRPLAPLRGKRYSAASVVPGGREVWLLGGRSDRAVLTTVEAYRPDTGTVRACPPMQQRRSGAVAGVIKDTIVVAGGACSGRLVASVEAYECATAAWTALPPLPHAAWLATACVLNGSLFVAGGVRCDKLQCWDGAEWSVRGSLPSNRWGAASVARDGKMLVIGGSVAPSFRETSSVLAYSVETDSWEPFEPLPEPRSGCWATIEHTGSILVVGGGAPFRYENGSWSTVAEACDFGSELASAVSHSVLLG